MLWHERLRPVWRDLRPIAVVTAVIAVIVLGTIGSHALAVRMGRPDSLLDSLYRAIALFELGGVDVMPPVPWTLQLARFLAPLIVGYALISGLLVLFRDRLQLIGIRLLVRNHVVVAGLGRMGFRLAIAFHDEGLRVIVIELDATNGSVQGCKERGITVLTGDARDRRMLAKARVDHARHLIAVCGEDGPNVEVAVAAGRVGPPAGGVLHALVHLDDAGLWRMLKAEAIARPSHAGTRVEFFNVFEIGARMLLAERPPFGSSQTSGHAHVLVVGLDGIGDALVLNVARLWQSEKPEPGQDLRLTIITENAEAEGVRLLARYPELEGICDLRAVSATPGVELQRGALGVDVEPSHPISTIYICISEEAQALEAALALRARSEMRTVPLVVAVNDARAGLATVLQEDPQTAHGAYGFGVLNRTLQVLPLLRGINEVLARAKHEEYLRHQRAVGRRMGEGSMVAWDELPEQFKDANRAFADGIGAKLEAAGCVLVPAPLIDPDGPLFTFTDEEVEELGRLEHERWMADKLRNGWRYGVVRDDAKKLHPLLVGWERLAEVERDKDRDPVREIPVMLAGAGFEIWRAGERPLAGGAAVAGSPRLAVRPPSSGAGAFGREPRGRP